MGLASPISINLNTGRKTKAKPLAVKPEAVADLLTLGFGQLEKTRGDHWKRSKAECLPFANALTAIIPDLPPELLKQIEKATPWASLVITAAFLVGPGLLAEMQIAKYKQEIEELKRRGALEPNPNTTTTDRNTTNGPLAPPTSGGGAGDASGSSLPTDNSTNAQDDSGVPAFGKFGNIAA